MTFVYAVCTLLGFYGNRAWVFEHKGRVWASFIRYGLVYLAGDGADWLILHVFVDGLGCPHQFVQAAAICVLAAYFFLALKFFVFRHRPAGKPQFSLSP
jgi:putative flippase GtrA